MNAEALNKHIGAAIRAMRLKHGKNQTWLAGKLGIGLASLSRWETGARWIAVVDLWSVIKIFDASISDFLPCEHIDPSQWPLWRVCIDLHPEDMEEVIEFAETLKAYRAKHIRPEYALARRGRE